ncbi:16S rRNA (guanine(527)-N(7))-methyltransferase RsmG [Nocardiopsis xinjiangensis]|uniref:16S rRNA (guanine(527)-N(7))-methyltransferase RsmG n=1 Tax=Nocardiopsis xinjiangensis TaxID=124285 RepID=UPI0004756CF4|nr:16S rRNA (guanine(527)-N(7))-methyltransferase RsmG [Nocardiopsis xinjiangensis]
MTSGPDVPPAAEPPPPEAEVVFGESLPRVRRYADLLADDGVRRGLIGPREVPRLWGRHIINCAVVEEILPEGAQVIDVGSGAGLPGIVLGLLRPDLEVTLLEPLLRRTVFLEEAVELLELPNVQVYRGRAEEVRAELSADFVTARAVAPLGRLAGWSLPLLRKNGSLLALKGEQAEAELAAVEKDVSKLRPSVSDVIRVGRGKVDPATTVVRVTVTSDGGPPRGSQKPRGGKKKRGRKR